jgi:hypothetical protein
MGSPKRQLISGTGSRTNAFTDFHHTVFFASCPVQTPDQFWKKPMLPMALDALLDVMTTTVDDDRLEKERAAVLSEASMVNKMEYRVECQILSLLHDENRISKRFPIGKEELIQTWTKEDVQLYHSLHYRPDNVVLYLVGDLDPQNALEVIKAKFEALQPKIDSEKVFAESGEFPVMSMRQVNRHFPPVVHRWSCSQDKLQEGLGMVARPKKLHLDAAFIKEAGGGAFAGAAEEGRQVSDGATTSVAAAAAAESEVKRLQSILAPNCKVFQHELLQAFSFHLFAKRPLQGIVDRTSLKRDLLRRIVLSALQIRLNVMQRTELFTFADFNQLNWPREGCAVCSFDMSTDTVNYQEAIYTAVLAIRRLGKAYVS